MRKFIQLSALVIGMEVGSSAFGAIKPYCTGGSDAGAKWWNWTGTNVDQACGVVFKKILSFNAPIHRGYYGFYNTATLNKGRILCKGGATKNVIGTGSQIFENALNMATELNYVGCVFKLTP